MTRLVWTQWAIADREEIFTYIEADSPNAAAAMDERIASAVRRLLDFPESGRPGRIEGSRELVVPRSPYIAVYALAGDRIRILRVLHGARLWPDEIEEP
jgi:addiction module RelE/StbE family toxin